MKCNKCNKSECGCSNYSGKNVLYTGVNLSEPFEFKTNSTFNEFVTKTMDYLAQISPLTYKLTFVVTPVDATIKVNGVETSEITGIAGTIVNVEVTAEGYQTLLTTYVIGSVDRVVNIDLIPVTTVVTITFVSNPIGANITINGVATSTHTGLAGSVINLGASLVGYINYFSQYTLPSSSGTHTIELIPNSTPSFDFYWGEIGNIYTSNPSLISESNWDSLIKPNGTGGNMSKLTVQSLGDTYSKDSTEDPLQWWILMVPNSVGANLSAYTWYTWDSFNSNWIEFTEHSPYEGSVTLDGTVYNYTAIRPNQSIKIRISK